MIKFISNYGSSVGIVILIAYICLAYYNYSSIRTICNGAGGIIYITGGDTLCIKAESVVDLEGL